MKIYNSISEIEKEQERLGRIYIMLDCELKKFEHIVLVFDEDGEVEEEYLYDFDLVLHHNCSNYELEIITIDEAEEMLKGKERMIRLDEEKSRELHEVSVEFIKGVLRKDFCILEKDRMCKASLIRTLLL